MTTAGGDGPGDRPASRWERVAPDVAGCSGGHRTGGGSIDESARRLSHEEHAVARLLAAEGHEVRSVRESHTGGRTADLEACGRPVEIKSYERAEFRGWRRPSPQSVHNKLVSGAGQADVVVIVGFGSGLTEATVRRGLARYNLDPRGTSLTTVRAVGDGFDIAWSRRRGLGRDPGTGARARPPAPDRGPAGRPRPAGATRAGGARRSPPGAGIGI